MNEEIMKERRLPGTKRNGDVRNEYDRDEARLIHSAAFRRLQSKTQVLGLGESDFYRTRLTHSMEVAQIGRGIVHSLKDTYPEYIDTLPDDSLMTAICLAHDIGHPPFGHGGEVALNFCMRNHGGFEGNGQTLRILGKLEKYTEQHGINPTRRMLLGVLKYPVAYKKLVNDKAYDNERDNSVPSWLFKAKNQKPPKCYHDSDQDIVDFIFKEFSSEDVKKFTQSKSVEEDKHQESKFKSLDCSIMNLADNISYSLHDFEDALSLKLITIQEWNKHFDGHEFLFDDLSKNGQFEYDFNSVTEILFSAESYERKEAIGSLVHLMISNTFIDSNNSGCTDLLLSLKVELRPEIERLRNHIFKLVKDEVILNENVQQLEFKGQKLVIELFQTLARDPERFLPKSTLKNWKKAADNFPQEELEAAQLRVICDFVAGMTDDYATRFYEKLFVPHKGSIFERL